jgi:Flp pilus assembly protein TadG
MIGRSFVPVLKDRRGVVAIVMAIALPVVVGAAGLGVEAGTWYMMKRQAQTAADAGAFAGALELAALTKQAEPAAVQEAARNGFTTGGKVEVEVNNPPKTGPKATKANAIEVIVKIKEPLLLATLFKSGTADIEARAVGFVEQTGNACILALNKTKDKSLVLTGSSTVVLDNCSLASNSSGDQSILFSGSQDTVVPSVWTAGGVGSNGSSTLPPNMNTYAWAVEDPYKDLTVPKPLPVVCKTFPGGTYSGVLSPGVFCGDVKLNTVDLKPGTYYIDQGNLTVNSNATVRCPLCGAASTGAGVTFVLTSSDPKKDAGDVTINGTSDVVLRAPSASPDANGIVYPYPGMLIVQDPDSTVKKGGGGSTLNGNTNLVLDGALYFPKSTVDYSGNSGSASCTLIVADTVILSGKTKMTSSGCTDLELSPISAKFPALVE